MSPNMFVVAMTSNCSGLSTSCMAALSMIFSSTSTRPSYWAATARPSSRNRPETILRMFALWTSVTFLRPCLSAYSNAYCTIREQPSRVTIAMLSATARGSSPIWTKCSTPAYRPCVFSRISTTSTWS